MLNEILYLNPSRQTNNYGVNGYGTEAANMMVVAKIVKSKFDKIGILKKIVLTQGLTLSQAIAESNAVGATLHLDIHSDAGGGRGCTGIYKSDKGKQFISCIYKHVSALTPTSDRGLSYRTDLGALNQTRATAGLIECFFHDNADDVAFYRSQVDALAQAIVDGVLEYLGVNSVTVAAAPVLQAPAIDNSALNLQCVMNKLWFTDNEGKVLVEDGVMGSRTKQAVIKFQKVMGLSADGIAGSKTFGAIDSILAKPLCKFASDGYAVRYLQFRFGLAIDGKFGVMTKGKVQSYQHDMGLVADGIVGHNTWDKLLG